MIWPADTVSPSLFSRALHMEIRTPRYSLLVGAGASPNLPNAREVIFPLLQHFLDRPPNDQECVIRFELLMQMIKEYLDPSLTFISRIYTESALKAELPLYSRVFAALAASGSCRVFTTNFDLNIEAADQSAFRPFSRRLESTHTVERFSNWIENQRASTFFKLHGSAIDPHSLAATYDSVSWLDGKNDARHVVFSSSIAASDLWVVGYSGYDDMDVVPTIVNTPAIGKKLVWFHHRNGNECGLVNGRKFLENPDSVDPRIREAKLPILPIVQAISKTRTRRLEDIEIHFGPTETTFSKHLDGTAVSRRTKKHAHALRTSTGAQAPRLRWLRKQNGGDLSERRRRTAEIVIENWFRELPLGSRQLSICVAAEAVHTQDESQDAAEKLAGRLKGVKEEIQRLPPSSAAASTIMLNPGLAALIYWSIDENVAEKTAEIRVLCEETETLIAELLEPGARGEITHGTPMQVATGAAQVFVWLAEAYRYGSNFPASDEILSHRFVSAPEELAYQLLRSGRFNCPEATTREQIAADSAIIHARATALTTVADLHFSSERFAEAQRSFEEAIRLWSRIGHSYWRLYCNIGLASRYVADGRLSEAEVGLEQARTANSLSGYTEWQDYHPSIQLADIKRLRQSSEKSLQEARESLKEAADQEEDLCAAELAKRLDWALDFTAHQRASDQLDERFAQEYAKLDSASVLAAANRLRADIFYLELLVRAKEFEQARNLIRRIGRTARRLKLDISRAKILLYRDWMGVAAGRKSHSKRLYDYCVARKFEIGAAWAAAILKRQGRDPLDAIDLEAWTAWAQKNGLQLLADELAHKPTTPGAERQMPISFPFGWH